MAVVTGCRGEREKEACRGKGWGERKRKHAASGVRAHVTPDTAYICYRQTESHALVHASSVWCMGDTKGVKRIK